MSTSREHEPTQLTSPVLLYDGTCGFCAGSVQFVLKRDRKRTLSFAALDSVFGRAVLARHPELRAFDSMLYVEPATGDAAERISAHSAAVMRVASYLGGAWRLLQLARVVPAPLRDALYRTVARHRHRLSGTRPQCVVPSTEDRLRFLE